MIGDVIYCRIILCFSTSMLDFLMIILLHILVVMPLYDSTDDVISSLGCCTRGMARAHDGLMMPLMVGRNRVPSLVTLFIAMLFMFVVMLLLFNCDVTSVHCDVSLCSSLCY